MSKTRSTSKEITSKEAGAMRWRGTTKKQRIVANRRAARARWGKCMDCGQRHEGACREG